MENVIVLTHDESVVMDGATVKALEGQLGSTGAEGVICRAMEEIANRLSLIERCYYEADWHALWKASKGLVGIADQVGLGALAVAAAAVADCAKGNDAVALAAVQGRLVRIGDRALTAVWDLPESSNF